MIRTKQTHDHAFLAHMVVPVLVTFVFFVMAIFLVILPLFESWLMDQKRLQIQSLIDTVHFELAHYAKQERAGLLSREEAQQDAIAHLRPLRYGPEGKDYFWINDMHPRMIMHPYRTDLEGQDISSFADPNGKHLFVEVVEAVSQSGFGYVDYMWQWKDDPGHIVPKISYVRAFEPWGWVVGTGVYIEDVRAELAHTRRVMAILCGAILLVIAVLCAYLVWEAYAINERRRKAEQKTRDSEETFRALAEGSVDTIMRFDREHRHLYVNPAAQQTSGIPVADFIGKTHAELGFPPDLVALWGEALDTVLTTGKVNRIEFRLPTGIWIDWVLVPEFEDAGEIRAIITSARDVTERKRAEDSLRESETRYRALFEDASDGILLMAGDVIVDCNPAALALLGRAREEVLGRTPADFSPECQPDGSTSRESAAAWLTAAREVAPQSFEWQHEHENGTPQDTEVSLTRVVLGEEPHFLAVIRDITERKQQEEEKRQLEAQLRQSHKMEAIGTLAGGIAHDFNNLLWAITGNVELALMDELPDDHPAAYSLKQVLGAASQAKELVAQILAFSRQQEEELGPIEFSVIIKETAKLLRASLPATIHIDTDLRAQSDVVMGDPSRLQQVMMNLCTNAAHAMRRTGGRLHIATENLTLDVLDFKPDEEMKAGGYFRLSVGDTGEGMPSMIADRIFEPYFTTKSVGEGTGLGLAVVHGIVKKLGGRITLESKEGEGTTFTVLLPLVDAAAQAREAQAQAPVRGSEQILLVDDQSQVLEMLKRLLERIGYAVTERTSGAEALKEFDADPKRFDLVVTDMTMPNMTGDVLARELLKRRPGMPIILCTGYSETMDEEACADIGVREIVMKPVRVQRLSEAIRRALPEPAAGREGNTAGASEE